MRFDSKNLDPTQGVATNSGPDGGEGAGSNRDLFLPQERRRFKESNVSSSC